MVLVNSGNVITINCMHIGLALLGRCRCSLEHIGNITNQRLVLSRDPRLNNLSYKAREHRTDEQQNEQQTRTPT